MFRKLIDRITCKGEREFNREVIYSQARSIFALTAKLRHAEEAPTVFSDQATAMSQWGQDPAQCSQQRYDAYVQLLITAAQDAEGLYGTGGFSPLAVAIGAAIGAIYAAGVDPQELWDEVALQSFRPTIVKGV